MVYGTKIEYDRAWRAIENEMESVSDRYPTVADGNDLSPEDVERTYEGAVLQAILRAELKNMTYTDTNISIYHQKIPLIREASKLRVARKNAGFSQLQLSQHSGVALGMIRKYECGERDIRHAQADNLIALSITLGIGPGDLI